MATVSERFRIALITGGVKSGKSRWAQQLAESLPPPYGYLATGEARDEEMQARIARHQADRGEEWETREEPLALAAALREMEGRYRVILVDCLTMWLTNLLLRQEAEVAGARRQLREVLQSMATPVILVGNEVGWGIVPENPLARRFRDEAGGLHQELAALADLVVLVVNGLPLCLKGKLIFNQAKE